MHKSITLQLNPKGILDKKNGAQTFKTRRSEKVRERERDIRHVAIL
jgi:hypothetical protein